METAMPYVNIKKPVARNPECRAKAELIRGVTELLTRSQKNPETTVVVIDEIDMDNWGTGGKSVTVRRAEARNK